MSLLKSYGKVNETNQETFVDSRRRTIRRRITTIALSSVVIIIVVVSAVVGTSRSKNEGNASNGKTTDHSFSASVKTACGVTLYPDSCYKSLYPLLNSSRGGVIQPEELYKVSIQVAVSELSNAVEYFIKEGGFGNFSINDKTGVAAAIESCRELLDLALDSLNSSLPTSDSSLFKAADDFSTWLSAAGTYQETCVQGFDNTTLRSNVLNYLKNSTEFTSNSLAIVKEISNAAESLKLRRRLLSTRDKKTPLWLSQKDQRLLQSSKVTSNVIKADVVVAKDGSGKYKTIGDALKAVPAKSKKRFVIYVKKGVYNENIRVEKEKWNVMMIGDGMDKTIVSASLNVVDGTPTFLSATFSVLGQGFVARDMGFRNTAGAIKHQAVALMSNSDRSIFYRCKIDAFQDSLYTHANRQFYRECDVYGTVDFIFGNSAVIFQNCNIFPRVPMPGQQNTITAQGKIDPNQNTGIVIQNCNIVASGNLNSVRTFLGRPWKNYSTTLYLNTVMGSLIDPQGWLPWIGTSAPDTIFYGEYQNFGPGSLTKNRVKWKGLKTITTKQASKFTVDSFIKGSDWIKAANVNYKSTL